VPPAPLSFRVYTLDDLERRSDAPLSLRTSYANFDATASRGSSRAGGGLLALWIALASIDLKKLGVTMGIVVGASLTTLFAVLIVAELTDDVRPGAAARLASSEILVRSAMSPTTPAAPVAAAPVAAPAAVPAVAPAVEEHALPAPASPPKRAAKKPAKPKAPRPYRTSDALFNP
jgi:hypothetical protein